MGPGAFQAWQFLDKTPPFLTLLGGSAGNEIWDCVPFFILEILNIFFLLEGKW